MKKLVLAVIIGGSLLLAGCGAAAATNAGNNTTKETTTADTTKTADTAKTAQTTTVDITKTISSPQEALNLLKEGNARFVADKSEQKNIDQNTRNTLKDGQHPYATIVSCSDSRVTPSIVFNAGLGELFDIRLAGNVVDDDALGSIEYAVDHLHTPLIVVMGHQKCGAVTATYDAVKNHEDVHGKLESVVEKIEPSVNPNGTVDDAIHKNVENMVKEIEKDPIVAAQIKAGKVKVVGAYYDLDGKVVFDDASMNK